MGAPLSRSRCGLEGDPQHPDGLLPPFFSVLQSWQVAGGLVPPSLVLLGWRVLKNYCNAGFAVPQLTNFFMKRSGLSLSVVLANSCDQKAWQMTVISAVISAAVMV